MDSITYLDFHPPTSDFHADVMAGLGRPRKALSPKYFYDERGSQLFDAICELDEYYPTRTETSILDRCAADVDRSLCDNTILIEYGSGSSVKIRRLLDSSGKIGAYIPIDISREHLKQSAERLAQAYPRLSITAVCADYTRLNGLPRLPYENGHRRTVFFPGSTIGNLDREDAKDLLRSTYELLNGDGDMMVGIDLIKDLTVLLAAYNDREGITAAFNTNLLTRMNRELGTDFDVEAFEHRAIFNPQLSRIEMHLLSRKKQSIHMGEQRFDFAEGETIHTESSHKYDLPSFFRLAREAGFSVADVWTDDRNYFAEVLLRTHH